MTKKHNGFALYVGNQPCIEDLIQQTSALPVIRVADAFEAIDLCLTANPRVIVLDRHLPQVDGAELLEHFRDSHWIDDSKAMMINESTEAAEKTEAICTTRDELRALLEF